MNILTFDIEEWAMEARRQAGVRPERIAQYDELLHQLLDEMEAQNMHATCFCTGQMAEYYPQIIQMLSSKGHEIACHSHLHTWCDKLTYEQLAEDTHRAVDTLQQCTGKKVRGYRAPAFSITGNTPYAFEILAQNGIEYDASVFPAKRDFGGWASFKQDVPTRICYKQFEIHEYPIPMCTLFGQKVAYSGGGYFRFFPYRFIQRTMSKQNYAMTYFHIGDLITDPRKMLSKQAYENYFKEPGTLFNRAKRYIKSNLGTGDALSKLKKLLNENTFLTIEQAESLIDWNNSPVVQLP